MTKRLGKSAQVSPRGTKFQPNKLNTEDKENYFDISSMIQKSRKSMPIEKGTKLNTDRAPKKPIGSLNISNLRGREETLKTQKLEVFCQSFHSGSGSINQGSARIRKRSYSNSMKSRLCRLIQISEDGFKNRMNANHKMSEAHESSESRNSSKKHHKTMISMLKNFQDSESFVKEDSPEIRELMFFLSKIEGHEICDHLEKKFKELLSSREQLKRDLQNANQATSKILELFNSYKNNCGTLCHQDAEVCKERDAQMISLKQTNKKISMEAKSHFLELKKERKLNSELRLKVNETKESAIFNECNHKRIHQLESRLKQEKKEYTEACNMILLEFVRYQLTPKDKTKAELNALRENNFILKESTCKLIDSLRPKDPECSSLEIVDLIRNLKDVNQLFNLRTFSKNVLNLPN